MYSLTFLFSFLESLSRLYWKEEGRKEGRKEGREGGREEGREGGREETLIIFQFHMVWMVNKFIFKEITYGAS
jgi:predicted transposase YdaD